MSATAIWTVHCHGCAYWDERTMSDSRRKSEANARKLGWLVETKGQGGQNYCPDCKRSKSPTGHPAS